MSDDYYLQSILNNPEDDASRLQYADHLDGQGNPRGEFIRLQIELAGVLPPAPLLPSLAARDQGSNAEEWECFSFANPFHTGLDWVGPGLSHVQRYTTHRWRHASDERARELLQREEELLKEHAQEWIGSSAGEIANATFARGFVESVVLDAENFLAESAKLIEQFPLRGVTFTELYDPEGLPENEALSRLFALDFFGGDLDEESLTAILQSPHLGNLKALGLGGFCYEDQAKVLVESSILSNLTGLYIRDGYLTDAAVKALASATGLAGLTHLTLASCSLGDKAMGHLATGPWSRLTALDVCESNFGDEGMRVLANAGVLSELTTLNLDGCGISDKGAALLAESSYLGQLREVNLCNNMIGMEGLMALVKSSQLAKLEVLLLGSNSFGEEKTAKKTKKRSAGITSTFLSTFLYPPHVTTLSLHENGLEADAVKQLAETPSLAKLTHLNLAENQVRKDGVRELISSEHLGNLQYLNLHNNELDDDAAGVLAGATSLNNLQTLIVSGNDINDESVETLRSSLSGLKKLQIEEEEYAAVGSAHHEDEEDEGEGEDEGEDEDYGDEEGEGEDGDEENSDEEGEGDEEDYGDEDEDED